MWWTLFESTRTSCSPPLAFNRRASQSRTFLSLHNYAKNADCPIDLVRAYHHWRQKPNYVSSRIKNEYALIHAFRYDAKYIELEFNSEHEAQPSHVSDDGTTGLKPLEAMTKLSSQYRGSLP